MNETTNNCAVCDRSEMESANDSLRDWICCDECQKWFHFACVGVTTEIAKNDWTCSACKTKTKASSQSNPSLTSRGAVPKAPNHNLTNPQRNIDDNNNKIQKAVSDNYSVKGVTNSQFSQNLMGKNTSASKILESNEYSSPINNDELSGNTSLLLSMLEEERQAKEDYIKRKYLLLSQAKDDNLNALLQKSEVSTKQMAARHAIPSELPLFSGEPEEWPTFISAFEYSTNAAGFSDIENMLRLQKCLKGKARELVKDKLLLPSMVNEVIKTLKLFFGRPEHIIERMVDRVRKLPPIKDKLENLIELAVNVNNICATMQACNLEAHLNNPILLKELVEKLPNHYKLSWAMHVRTTTAPNLKNFNDWIYGYAEVAATVVSPTSIKIHSVNAHTNQSDDNEQNDSEKTENCIVCEKSDHKLTKCEKFQKLSVNERLQIVKDAKLCFRCLKKHRQRCFKKSDCGINGCKSKHNQLLHQADDQNATQNVHGVVSAHQSFDSNEYLFRIIPVKLHGKNKVIQTFAFLDEGSSVTLINKNIFDQLDTDGVKKPLCLQWTDETTRTEDESICASIQISGIYSVKNKYWLNGVQTIKNLSLPQQSIDANHLKSKYSYLSATQLSSYENAAPGLLIGSDNWKVAIPFKICEGNWNEPIASKCRLGWAIQGGGKAKTKRHLNVHQRCECEALHEAVKNSFNLEASINEFTPKPDESKATQILNETCIKKNGQYEVGLLWRENIKILPESYNMAMKRVQCLDQKIKKDPSLKQTLQAQIDNLVSKGYAKKLTQTEIAQRRERVWYLPIFTVKNPNKPKKVRLVWDAAAVSEGVSLNDFLLSGPDLLNSLIDVLTSFRVGKIAVCADIAEMFHRIKIKDSDMHAQRFLWRKDGDVNNKPDVYVMKAMTFGIRCAPCIAHYVRDKNAEEFKHKYTRAFEAIQQAHYVDDFIDSMSNEKEAIEVSLQVREIHAAGGFHIRNWSTNSMTVLDALGERTDTQQKIEIGDTEKVLGMFWDPNIDIFRFIFRFARMKRNFLSEPTIPTKRELLQVLMSMFDPLGFLASHTISLKILLQKVWRSNIGWDSQLPSNLHSSWLQCKRIIQEISDLTIPRCYSPYISEANDVQLHTFVDASEDAYAAVSYLRISYNETVTTSLVLAKSKVAPLKPLSVPRLELQAAVLGTRLSQRVQKIRRLNIDKKYFWSDSKTVLRWLRMDPKGFQQFVMYRVGEILDTTDVSQWRWVPSKFNAADQATKVKPQINSQFWLNGPDFLMNDCREWPQCDDFGETDTSEMKKRPLHVNKVCKTEPLFKFENFSSWVRLYRSLAALITCIKKRLIAKQNLITNAITIYENIEAAKTLLFKEAQKQTFLNEINTIKRKEAISRQSTLVKLEVYLDKNDVLRAKGRVDSLNSNEGVIVLPKESYITYLIVKNYHEKSHHIVHETTINLIRCDFYIPKLRVLYKTVRHNCQWCKNNLAKAQTPQMAPIPAVRLASFQRAFSHVGIDYFGPFLINVGRHKEKRWGVIFTCLTIRAIHLEVAHSLDTSSCIMCIKNFISRRGTPISIYSDNGTNFKGAEKVIKEEIAKVDFAEIEIKFDAIKWYFNPPSAPHMGGIWERLIRSVKTTLKIINPSANFNDETFRSALCEIEFIINARPLTFVSIDAEDEEALTPNHILLGSPSGYKPFAIGNDLRQHWKQSQAFADRFWHRWVKEYLPIITRRSKWFTKCTPIKVNDIVIIVDENLPRNCWPKGKIVDTVVAKDGQVRRVMVKTQHGLMMRPVAKIAVLDVGIDHSKLDLKNLSYAGENVAAVK